LKLAGNVVIVDEAHNLVAAINSSHSVIITAEQLASTSELLLAYMNTFQQVLGSAKAATVTSIKGTVDRMTEKAADVLKARKFCNVFNPADIYAVKRLCCTAECFQEAHRVPLCEHTVPLDSQP
jgi:Rad3-related DNA helicase